MKIFVTGASGFIGSQLVPHLIRGGHEVTTFGRTQPVFEGIRATEFNHIVGDITDQEKVSEAIKGNEIVFHMAGFISYRKVDKPRQYEINVLGTRYVMEAALKHGVKRVIHTGSIAGMGIPKPGEVADENTPYNLAGLGLNYCDSKHDAQMEVLKYCKMGLPALILSPGIIFGEGDTHVHHHTIFAAIAKGNMFGCPAGGVTFSDILDVVDAHLKAMTAGRPGQNYVIGSANLTYLQAAGIFCRVLKTKPPTIIIPGFILETLGNICEFIFPLLGKRPPLTRQIAWLSQRRIFFSSDKAIKELGLQQTTFDETIIRTAPYYLSRISKSGSKQFALSKSH
ncbi:MAG: NAD-dependent epimerase/dehydratase family protein [Candidatus Obscuribacterales bacterium]|nr:NAD-dependent epimerase/dehydratase family protein [Candidatus Obscuribacterales bacterium]